MKTIRVLIIVALLLSAKEAWAIAAADCTAAAVTTAIAGTLTGGTVTIPACAATTWTAGVTVGVKNLTIQGAGIGQTIIELSGTGINYDTDDPGIHLETTSSRVTGIEFHFIGADATGAIKFDGHNVRIDNNRFEWASAVAMDRTRVAIYSRPDDALGTRASGVVYDNEFLNTDVVVAATRSFPGESIIWAEPLLLGVAQGATNVIYVEHNSWVRTQIGDAMDSEYAARYVFRFNNLTGMTNGGAGATAEAHSMRKFERTGRGWEVYGNTFACPLGFCQDAVQMRSGTGMVFNNTITGSYFGGGTGIDLDNQRSFVSGTLGKPAGYCNGLNNDPVGYGGGFLWYDKNTTNGWPCRDQIGRGDDASLFAGTCTIDVSCNTALPDQASKPAYFFLNTLNGSYTAPAVVNCSSGVKTNGSCADIVSARDYFKYNSASASTTTTVTDGVGSGVRGSRPASTTNGEAYWSTDFGGNWNRVDAGGASNDGCLDIVVAAAWVPCAYTPYEYPHPLSREAETNTPQLIVVPFTVTANTTATKTWACPTGGGATLMTTEAVGSCVIPGVPGAVVGTIDNLYAVAETAPDNGAGDQAYIITFSLNLCIPSGNNCTYGTALDQDLYCAIAEAALTCTDTYTVTGHRVTLHGGDHVSWMYLARITPTASRLSVTARYIPATNNERIWMWNSNTTVFDTTTPNYSTPHGSLGPSNIEANRSIVTAIAGTIKNNCVDLRTAPGAGASRVFAVSIAASTSGTSVVSFPNTSGTTCDTSTAPAAFASGDNLNITQGVSGAAPVNSTAGGGFTIVNAIDNVFMIPADTTGGMDANNDRYLSLGATIQTVSGTAGTGTALSADVTIVSVAGKLGGGAGAGNEYDTTLRDCSATGTCANASSTFPMALTGTTLVNGTGTAFVPTVGHVYSTRIIPISQPNSVSATVTYLLSMDSTSDVAPACASVQKYALLDFHSGTTGGQITQTLVNSSAYGDQNVAPLIPLVGAGAPMIFDTGAHIDFPGLPRTACVRPWNNVTQSAVGMTINDDNVIRNLEYDFQGKLPDTVTMGFYFRSDVTVLDNDLNEDFVSLRGTADFTNIALQVASGTTNLSFETSDAGGLCVSETNAVDVSNWVWITLQKTILPGSENKMRVYNVNQTTGAITGGPIFDEHRAPCNPDLTYIMKLGHHAVAGSMHTHKLQYSLALVGLGSTPIFPLLPTSFDASSGGTAVSLMLLHAGQ